MLQMTTLLIVSIWLFYLFIYLSVFYKLRCDMAKLTSIFVFIDSLVRKKFNSQVNSTLYYLYNTFLTKYNKI